MITLIQRVSKAKVSVAKEELSSIGKGLLLYIGFEDGDNLEKIQ